MRTAFLLAWGHWRGDANQLALSDAMLLGYTGVPSAAGPCPGPFLRAVCGEQLLG